LGVLLAAIVGAAMITGSLIFVVASRTSEIKAGYALHALHQQRARLARQRSELRLEIAALTRPERLAQLAPRLGLAPPTRAQVLPPREAQVQLEGPR
jgi:cell division protein FtsL